MLDVRYSSRFKKDVRLCTKRGYKMELLRQAIDILRDSEHLPRRFCDHAVKVTAAEHHRCQWWLSSCFPNVTHTSRGRRFLCQYTKWMALLCKAVGHHATTFARWQCHLSNKSLCIPVRYSKSSSPLCR